jgi:hypothetical protein
LEQVWNLGIIAKCYCSQVSKIITKLENFDSISNPKEVKVVIKIWKLQTIFTTFNPKEKVLDGFKLAAPQECMAQTTRLASFGPVFVTAAQRNLPSPY